MSKKKQRVTRAVYGVYVAIVAAFSVASVTQIGGKAFSADSSARLPTVGAECGTAIQLEIGAIEAARIAASSENGVDAAKIRYAKERAAGTHLEDTKQHCAADSQGPEALAALARLDRAAEAHAVRAGTELSPVRLAAQSFISGHNR